MKPELILVRGLPGSGKSTIAKKFLEHIHFEADMFWGDDYNFDINRVREAHQWCINQTKDTLKYCCDFLRFYPNLLFCSKGVIVSNTFTTLDELWPYFDLAKSLEIVPQVILCQGNFGSIHDVPVEVIEIMKNRFQYDISSLF